ncbi:MAG: Bug family tripartite tricarboxylate transporter substrate binding protein [Lautropia sp.]
MIDLASRTLFGAALAVAALGASAPATAQDAANYPSRSIRVVLPVVAGGGLDTVARALLQRMSDRLGQPMVVDNRPGAAGVIGTDIVAKSAPDGYTLLFAAAPIAMNTALGIKQPFDPARDFVPISLVASLPALFAVHPSTPYKTLDDVVEDSKRRPGGISYAIASVGAITHLIGEAWKAETGANLTMVAYKGAGQAIQDVVSGTVPLIIDAYIPSGAQVTAGKLRGLAIASNRRSPLLPDVPTVVELGKPGLIGSGFYGLLAPAGTPPAIIAKIHAALTDVFKGSDLRERLVAQGYEVHASTPEAYATFIRDEIARWTPVARAAGIKPE